MDTSKELVNAIGLEEEQDDEVNMELADALARNMIEGVQRKKVSATDSIGAFVLAAVILMLEEGLDDHDVYSAMVSLTGEMLREPEEESVTDD